MIYLLSEFAVANLPQAGGKGSTLARLYQCRYPVPGGFVILPSAFAGDDLKPEAWKQARAYLARLRRDRNITFAVRSSSFSEDSTQVSFAGEFETVLDIETDEAIEEAIGVARRSRDNERVRATAGRRGWKRITRSRSLYSSSSGRKSPAYCSRQTRSRVI